MPLQCRYALLAQEWMLNLNEVRMAPMTSHRILFQAPEALRGCPGFAKLSSMPSQKLRLPRMPVDVIPLAAMLQRLEAC